MSGSARLVGPFTVFGPQSNAMVAITVVKFLPADATKDYHPEFRLVVSLMRGWERVPKERSFGATTLLDRLRDQLVKQGGFLEKFFPKAGEQEPRTQMWRVTTALTDSPDNLRRLQDFLRKVAAMTPEQWQAEKPAVTATPAIQVATA